MKTYSIVFYASDHPDDQTTIEITNIEAASPRDAMLAFREELGGRVTDNGPFAHVTKMLEVRQ